MDWYNLPVWSSICENKQPHIHRTLSTMAQADHVLAQTQVLSSWCFRHMSAMYLTLFIFRVVVTLCRPSRLISWPRGPVLLWVLNLSLSIDFQSVDTGLLRSMLMGKSFYGKATSLCVPGFIDSAYLMTMIHYHTIICETNYMIKHWSPLAEMTCTESSSDETLHMPGLFYILCFQLLLSLAR